MPDNLVRLITLPCDLKGNVYTIEVRRGERIQKFRPVVNEVID